jgi:glutathione S-transferase
MAEYTLYCFAESGNAYKAALMLNLCRLDWAPRLVDYFNGETRSDAYRRNVNSMGEVPVLVHGDVKLSQSGVILDYLAERTRKFSAKSDDERREILRWLLFDNHKFTSYIATLRFLTTFAGGADPNIGEFLKGRAENALRIVEGELGSRDFIIGKRATIADFSMCGYLYFEDELGLSLKPYGAIRRWLDRIAALPGWKHPYDLMPRAYPQRASA